MPYIKEHRKERIVEKTMGNDGFNRLISTLDIETAGELNYAITEMIKIYFKNNGGNYQAINDIVGALEGAKAEFQRRVVAPYEDEKIKENGDVY